MELFIRKYRGLSVEKFILIDPTYAMWIFKKSSASGELIPIRKEVKRLIKIFDSKPFTGSCYECGKKATRFSLSAPSSSPYWWCDKCNPYNILGDDNMSVGKTYRKLAQYARRYLEREDASRLIRKIAKAKGLPKDATIEQIGEFFRNV